MSYSSSLRRNSTRRPRFATFLQKLAEYFFELQLRDKTHLKQNIWEWAGQNTLRGIFLTKLKERLDAAKSETEREQIEQAVRWGLAALDNREEPNQHEDQ